MRRILDSVGKQARCLSSKRIGILLGNLYLTRFGRGNSRALFNVTTIEKDGYDLAIEYRLTCDPLERGKRFKDRKGREQALQDLGSR